MIRRLGNKQRPGEAGEEGELLERGATSTLWSGAEPEDQECTRSKRWRLTSAEVTVLEKEEVKDSYENWVGKMTDSGCRPRLSKAGTGQCPLTSGPRSLYTATEIMEAVQDLYWRSALTFSILTITTDKM